MYAPTFASVLFLVLNLSFAVVNGGPGCSHSPCEVGSACHDKVCYENCKGDEDCPNGLTCQDPGLKYRNVCALPGEFERRRLLAMVNDAHSVASVPNECAEDDYQMWLLFEGHFMLVVAPVHFGVIQVDSKSKEETHDEAVSSCSKILGFHAIAPTNEDDSRIMHKEVKLLNQDSAIDVFQNAIKDGTALQLEETRTLQEIWNGFEEARPERNGRAFFDIIGNNCAHVMVQMLRSLNVDVKNPNYIDYAVDLISNGEHSDSLAEKIMGSPFLSELMINEDSSFSSYWSSVTGWWSGHYLRGDGTQEDEGNTALPAYETIVRRLVQHYVRD